MAGILQVYSIMYIIGQLLQVDAIFNCNSDHRQLHILLQLQFCLTHCILNTLSHTIYWNSPIPILGTSGYDIYIFLEKNG